MRRSRRRRHLQRECASCANPLGCSVRRADAVEQPPASAERLSPMVEQRAGNVAVAIRDASDADWSGIWSFLRHIVRAGDTYTWAPDVTEDDAHARWFTAAPWRVFVAVASNGEVVGTAKVGPNQGGPGAHVANASFMVDPDRAGEGIGRALGEHLLQFARDEG